jgi:phosphatidylserine decarboxylase
MNSVLYVYDRKRKKRIKEKENYYVNVANVISTSVFFPETIHQLICNQLTNYCVFEFEKENPKMIQFFIKTYNIKVKEAEYPLSHYKTLQDFFQRKLKANIHKIASQKNEKIFVSPVDCRILVFDNINIVKYIWIKGKYFSIENLLCSKKKAKSFENCSIVLCRLAPQDYHRFHFPIRAWYKTTKHISGKYYSVKPNVIKSGRNVFTENRRAITYLQTNYFGTIAYITVGATCVGSIVITCKPNQIVKKGKEYGTFAFGGSTIILLLPKNKIKFDKDLQEHSQKGIETFVRMGEQIGTFYKL